MYTHINTHMYIYAYMHTEYDTGKHLHLNPGSRITNYVTSGNFRTSPCLFPCERGRDGLTALGHVRIGWGEWRVHVAPWPWHPNRLHYDETDTEPVRLTLERTNPQVTWAWQVYPMWRQELKAPKPVQNYSGINLSQKLKKAAILSIHLLKILIQLFYLLQLKSDCLAWLNIIRKQQNEIKCIFCNYK